MKLSVAQYDPYMTGVEEMPRFPPPHQWMNCTMSSHLTFALAVFRAMDDVCPLTVVVSVLTVVVSALVATSVSFATTASSMDTTLLATVIPVPAVTAVAVDVPDEASSPLMSLALPRLRNIVWKW